MLDIPGSNQSIRRTLTRRLALALAVIGVIGALAAALLGNRYANLAYDRALFDDVAVLANQIEIRDGELHLSLPQAARVWLIADQGEEVRYRIIDLTKQRTVDSNGPLGAWDNKSHITGQPYFRDETIGTTDFRIAYMRRVVDPFDWPVLVEVGESRGNRYRMTRQIVAATVLLISTMIAVAVWLVRQGVRSALAPLAALEEEVAQRSGTHLAPLDPLQVPKEVRRLIGSINQMMQRVSGSMDAQNRFIANAAHQLRTPVAGLRLQAQIALKGGTPDSIMATIREIEDSAARAAHLIDQLLLLSRAEADGLGDLRAQAVDLAVVAQQVIERYVTQAIQRNIDLGYEGPVEPVMISGNPVLLTELLANLVDNAIRYGQPDTSSANPNGRITVSIAAQGDHVLLSVSDNGTGFPEAERSKLFERFYRPDSSGPAHQGGAGLGLAIVKEIADRHSARIEVSPAKGSGCQITVYFQSLKS